MPTSTVQPQLFPKMQPNSVVAGSDVASIKSPKVQKRDFWGRTKPEPKSYFEKVTVAPLGETKKSFMKNVVELFSAKTFKKVAPFVAVFATGITVGSLVTALAGPHIAAIAIGVAASSAFPPVGIAIASTLGAVLLAYGLYRTVKYFKNRLEKAEKAELEAQKSASDPFGDWNAANLEGVQQDNDLAQSIAPEDSISESGKNEGGLKPLN